MKSANRSFIRLVKRTPSILIGFLGIAISLPGSVIWRWRRHDIARS